ncbi:SPRY domain-containing protein [Heyndrickxia sporothermodurans]|uniref:SPRY domain-containing protein n=1 Tax=Heyndrickxia sporothermodurans TaxID=46224 RepID=UPI000D36BAEE|nr:SPRY domain-containing protein [Heyndrickxia sporothermodurans]PTY92864.1 hypothetical protein B5V90_01955 [Heyndrickxia sporothermodurans]
MTIVLDRVSSRLNLAEDGLAITSVSNSWGAARTDQGVRSGKWYWEQEVLDVSGSSKRLLLGVMNASHTIDNYVGYSTTGRAYYSYNGNKYASTNTGYGASYVIGDIVGVALDMDMGTIEFFKNGISQGVAYNNLLSLGEVYPAVSAAVSGASVSINFGAEEFRIAEDNVEAWKSLVDQGYKPYDVESARSWFDKFKSRNVRFTQMYLDHEETGYILASGEIFSVVDNVETNEEVIYKVESAGVEVETGIETTPFSFSFAVDKESLTIGSNLVRITVEDNAGQQFPMNFEIFKEDRDTFVYKRQGMFDASIPREGDVVFRGSEGYGLTRTGTGRITIDIPTEGKSNISKITIDGTPEIRNIVAKTYDMDLVQKEGLDPIMAQFKKTVSLKDLTVVLKAELRR